MKTNDENSLVLSAKNEIDHLINNLPILDNPLETSVNGRLIRLCSRHFDLFIKPVSKFYKYKDLELIHKVAWI